MNPHTTLRHRLVPGATAGLVLVSSLALSACGSSSSSSSSPSTSTSVSSASAASPSPASGSPSAANSGTPASSSAGSAGGSAGQHTVAQLAQAVGRTHVGGAVVPASVVSASSQAQTFSALASLQQELRTEATFTPAECGELVMQTMRGPATTSQKNSVIALDKNVSTVLIAANDVSGDPWTSDAVSHCASYTEVDKATKSQSAATSKGSVTVSPLRVDGLTDTHSVALRTGDDQNPIHLASGRLGATWLQVSSQNTKVDPAAALKDLAAQVQKLG